MWITVEVVERRLQGGGIAVYVAETTGCFVWLQSASTSQAAAGVLVMDRRTAEAESVRDKEPEAGRRPASMQCAKEEEVESGCGDPSYRGTGDARVSRRRCTGVPILFHGKDNRHGYLSQMYTSRFDDDSERFLCNEQYFQAAKARYFGDEATRSSIMRAGSPYVMKALGRKVKAFCAEAWDSGRDF